MSKFFSSILGLLVVGAALGGCAQTAAQHEQHHPAATPQAPAVQQPASASQAMSPERTAAMEKHMQSMQAMHEKMAAAKTPQARQALMAEHMKDMKGDMPMMKTMAGGMCAEKGMPGHGTDAQSMTQNCMDMCMGK